MVACCLSLDNSATARRGILIPPWWFAKHLELSKELLRMTHICITWHLREYGQECDKIVLIHVLCEWSFSQLFPGLTGAFWTAWWIVAVSGSISNVLCNLGSLKLIHVYNYLLSQVCHSRMMPLTFALISHDFVYFFDLELTRISKETVKASR